MPKQPQKKNKDYLDIPQRIYELSDEEKEILIWYRVQEGNVKDYLRDTIEKETTE